MIATMALTLLIGASPALAQNPETVTPPAAQCELHVWPGNGLRSIYSGWFHGGIVDGAVQGRPGYRKLPDQPLPSSRQHEILQSMPITETLGLKDYVLVLHETALDSHTLRRTQGRLQPGGTACYAELAIDDVFFQQDIVDGRFLKALIRFRQFGAGEAPERTFGTYVQEKLTKFPPKSPDEDAGPAIDELGTAYAQVIRDFGVALNKPSKKKSQK
jgi:hypothetical protein